MEPEAETIQHIFNPEHVQQTGSLPGSPRARVRVITSTHQAHVGTIMTGWDAYRADNNSTGVLIEYEGMEFPVCPDPGPGPYITPSPEPEPQPEPEPTAEPQPTESTFARAMSPTSAARMPMSGSTASMTTAPKSVTPEISARPRRT